MAQNMQQFAQHEADQEKRNALWDQVAQLRVPTGRDHFRLHKPGRTIGCIATKPECGDCWNKVRDVIRKTKTINMQVTTQPDWPMSLIQ